MLSHCWGGGGERGRGEIGTFTTLVPNQGTQSILFVCVVHMYIYELKLTLLKQYIHVYNKSEEMGRY